GDRIAAVDQLLGEVPPEDRQRFDSDGQAEVAELLDRARKRSAGDPQAAVRYAEGAARAAREHVDRVLTRRAEYRDRLEAAARARTAGWNCAPTTRRGRASPCSSGRVPTRRPRCSTRPRPCRARWSPAVPAARAGRCSTSSTGSTRRPAGTASSRGGCAGT